VNSSKLIFKLILFFFILFLSGVFILCLVPPVSRDALTHHLYVPKLYINNSGFFEIPYISFSYYPQLLDLLYCIPLYFKNDIIPKFIHFFFALLTSIYIYKYLKDKTDKIFAIAGALFFLSVPVILKLSITVYVDLGLVCFSFLSIYYLFKWKDNSLKYKYLVISGIFSGLVISVKYNGLITLLILTLLLPFLIPHNKRKEIKTFLYPAVFFITAMIVFSPWMIKNYAWTKNPTYPLFGKVFNSQSLSTQETTPLDRDFYFSKGTNHFVLRKIVYKENIFETMFIPLRIFFQGEDDNPKYFDGKLNIFLFILSLFYLFLRKKIDKKIVQEADFMLIFSALTIFIVFFKSDMRIRYISAVVPTLTIVSFLSLWQIKNYLDKKVIKKSLKIITFSGMFLLLFVSNFLYFINQFNVVKPFSYLSDSVSKSDYISKFRPEYKLIEYLNENSKADSKILALFLGRRGYYFDRDVRFRSDIFLYFIKNSKNSLHVLKNLKESGYDYLILRYDLFNNEINHELSNKQKKVVIDFFENQVSLLKKYDMYGVYQLK
jgi:hypothetical protein